MTDAFQGNCWLEAGGNLTAGEGGHDATGPAGRLGGTGSLTARAPIPPRGQEPDPSDAELLVVQVLTAPPGLYARIATDLPADLEGQLPVVQVTEVPGGARVTPTFDTAVIDYDAYAASRTEAKLLAAAARLMLLDSAGFITPDHRMWMSQVVEVRRPVLLPYDDNSDIRRFGGSVRVHLRFTA